jgi:hypothetical protein
MPADLKVWHGAAHAVVNSHSPVLRKHAGAGGASVEFLDPPRMRWRRRWRGPCARINGPRMR